MTKDEALIAQRSGANFCVIVPDADVKPKGQYVMAIFGHDASTRQHYSFHVKYPLIEGWKEKLIKQLLSMKRERA